MHTVDFDEASGLFGLLFCHGTSSTNLAQIMDRGLIRPDYQDVLNSVLENAPQLDDYRQYIEAELDGPLGLNARMAEHDVEFAAWLGNRGGVRILTEELPKVFRHGGEVYSTTWSAACRVAERFKVELPLPRHEQATPKVIMFRVPFELCARNEELPRSKYDIIRELSFDVYRGGYPDQNDLKEVKFLDPLPSNLIVWHGGLDEAEQQISSEFLSPRAHVARQNIRLADEFLDVDAARNPPA